MKSYYDIDGKILGLLAKSMATEIDNEILNVGSDSLDAISAPIVPKKNYKNKIQWKKGEYSLPYSYMPVYLKIGEKYKKIATTRSQNISCELETSHTPHDYYSAIWHPTEYDLMTDYMEQTELQLKVYPTLHCGFYIMGQLSDLAHCTDAYNSKYLNVNIRIFKMKPFLSKKGFFHESKS